MPPVINNPFNPKGRIMRTSFIINTIIIWILAFLTYEFGGSSWDPIIYVGTYVAYIVLFVVAVFAGIKRLRDTKKSVWLAIFLIFPIADIVFQIVLFFLPSEWHEATPTPAPRAQ